MDSGDIAYVQRLIGMPWERTGMHCWALVRMVQQDLFGRDVPLGPIVVPARPSRRLMMSQSAEDYGWTEVSRPEHGAVVRMHRTGGNPNDLEHAGVYLAIERGLILHTDNPHGCVLDTLRDLELRGWTPRYFVPLA
jgi:hypothetical protein